MAQFHPVYDGAYIEGLLGNERSGQAELAAKELTQLGSKSN